MYRFFRSRASCRGQRSLRGSFSSTFFAFVGDSGRCEALGTACFRSNWSLLTGRFKGVFEFFEGSSGLKKSLKARAAGPSLPAVLKEYSSLFDALRNACAFQHFSPLSGPAVAPRLFFFNLWANVSCWGPLALSRGLPFRADNYR